MSIQKALELLQLPDECARYEGQIQTRTNRALIVEETHDFTVSPKSVSVKTYVSTTSELFGAYTLNLLSNYLHAYGHDIVSIDENMIVTTKPRETGTGGHWFPWQKVELYSNETGHSFDVISDVGLNVDPITKLPSDPASPPVRPGVFFRIQKTITRSSSGTIRTWTSKRQFVRWSLEQLKAITGMTEEQIAFNTRMTFNSVVVDPQTHVTSIAMDIEKVSDNQIKGIFHINGEPATGSPNKIASYGKICPSFAFRWNLYNQPGTNAYGASATAGFNASQDNTITLVPGTVDSYNPETKVITYNSQLENDPMIVAYAEFLPAQGKNENAGRSYFVETGMEDIW